MAQQVRQHITRLLVARDYDHLSNLALQVVADILRARPDAAISFTTGRTTAGLYRLLRAHHITGRVDLSRARLVCSEEYVGIGVDHPISLFAWLRRELLDPCGLPAESVLRLAGDAPDLTEECRRFDAAIAQWGGLDLVVQSVGVNGHFGFNEPGSARNGASRVATLARSTIQSNAAYWDRGTQVPARGLTMGVAATLQARHVLLLATDQTKARALARAIHGPIDDGVPCSLLRLAPCLSVIADEAAGSALAPPRNSGDQ